ncbi:hypothetical protein WJX81_002816 [Elliptochloris bilobata]|uniref:Cytochrome P450 n=1 Tax=Elliptochloris bilobata TaxID=381761 RepID=A0AAW1RLF4_9CHLO
MVRIWSEFFNSASAGQLTADTTKRCLARQAAGTGRLRGHRLIQHWCRHLGGIIALRTYWRSAVVITDPFLLQEFFAAERAGAFEKPSVSGGFKDKVTGRAPEKGLFSEHTAHPLWKTVRKGVAPAFQPANLRVFHHHIVDIMQQLIAAIKEKGPGADIDMSDVGQRESFDTIGRVGFDFDFGTSRTLSEAAAATFADSSGKDVFQTFGLTLSESFKRVSNPLRRFMFFSPDVRRGTEAMQRTQDMARALLAHVQAGSPEPRSVAAHLLALRDPTRPGDTPLADARLQSELLTFFLAGSETTGHTIAWTMFLLGKHPEAMARLEAELDAAGLLVTPERPQPRTFTYADISKLPWLDACVKESMRLQPVAHAGLRRVATRDVAFSSGLRIPKGTTVLGSQLSLMSDPAWGWKDPDAFKPGYSPWIWQHPGAFKPERFSDADTEYLVLGPDGVSPTGAKAPAANEGSAKADNKAKRFTPFGNGIRNCVGQQLAMSNVPTAVAMLTAEFKMTLSPEILDKSIQDLEITRGTLQPKGAIPMRCVPRSSSLRRPS